MDAIALSLPEELMLLARRGNDGRRRIDDQTLHVAIAGSILAELAVQGTIEVRDKHLVITGVPPTSYLPQYRRIAQEPPARTQRWMARFQDRHNTATLCQLLVDKGILAKTSHTHLGIFTTVRYPDLDSEADAQIHERIQRTLDGEAPDERTAALIGLIDAAGLLYLLYPAAPHRRVREIVQGQWAPEAVKAAVEAVRVATEAAVAAVSTGGAT